MTFRNLKYYKILAAVLLFSSLLILSSCRKDEPEEETVFQFIDEVMNSWYYWYEEVPALDYTQYTDPQTLLDDLKYAELDKWSFIDKSEIIDALFNSGEALDIGFMVRFDATGNLRVLYVYNNSEAYNQGIRKGAIVEEIDGSPAKAFAEYKDLNAVFDNHTPGTYSFQIRDTDGTANWLSLTKTTITRNGIFYQNIFDVSGQKTGYLVYDSFLGYSEDELVDAVTYFKSNQIDELVIDLRYNSGGHIFLAMDLINKLVTAGNDGEPMFSYTHNDLVSRVQDTTINISSDPLNLDLERVFFITSEYSASASELVINSLEPYMDVILIGTPTRGKPMGMYGFEFEDWLLYPVTTKLINADGYGDFFEGLPVDKEVTDEGLDKDWGDETEPCLSQAFYYITHGAFTDTKSAEFKSGTYQALNNKIPHAKSYLILE